MLKSCRSLFVAVAMASLAACGGVEGSEPGMPAPDETVGSKKQAEVTCYDYAWAKGKQALADGHSGVAAYEAALDDCKRRLYYWRSLR